MRRPLTIMERRFPNTSMVDQHSVDIDANERELRSKVDRRNVLEYTFIGTDLEPISHALRRKPVGVAIVYQSDTASISGDKDQWTKEKIYMKSSVAGITAKLQLL